jgi:hypothetical protein
MGPPAKQPLLPRYEWTSLAPEQLCPVKSYLECNYLQGIEGDFDSSHTSFLHNNNLPNAERLKRDGAATLFSARDLTVDERTLRVGIRGQLTTFISDRRVSEVPKGFAIDFQYTAGRIFLKAFRETNPNDPLETKPTSASLAAGS